ncbi:MAG: hybrid sensor histidine kinase/response regulator [Burkholderiales bacterium]
MTHPLSATRDPVLPAASPWRKAWRYVVRPEPDRVLLEQLRLVHGNAALSFGATFPAAAMIVWLFYSAGQSNPLIAWLAAVGAGCAITIWLAYWFLRSHQTQADAARAYTLTLAVYPLYGSLWGFLSWLTLDQASTVNAIFLVCATAGVLTGGMTFMAPLLPVYAGFALLLVLPLSAKLFVQAEPGFLMLGGGAMLMLATVIGQAARSSRSIRSMIELRFAHEALLAQLRGESERANQARASAEAARHEAEAARQESESARHEAESARHESETARHDAETARHAAEAADLAKSKFLAAASHDLRQPIHAQGLFLDVLANTPLSVQQVEILASARVASRASAEMLNTLLDFSRIEAGVVQPHRQPFAMQTLLHRIENDLAPLADAKSLAYRSRETEAVVDSDAALVEMILRNLMSNAIRYTDRGGVLIACRRRGDRLLVEVRDTGIGIAPEHHEEVFREFHQLGNPERDRRKGLGLGLAIAKGLAEACGHALTLKSQPGRGSTFRLSLPLTQTAPVPDALASGPSAASANVLRGLRVLVLDDDEAICAGMAHLLRKWGCECDTAETIDAALASARATPPAVFITDYRLREQQTGTAAIEALRLLLGADLPALLITGDTAADRLREASKSGVTLLHKPVSPEQLLQALVLLVRAEI